MLCVFSLVATAWQSRILFKAKGMKETRCRRLPGRLLSRCAMRHLMRACFGVESSPLAVWAQESEELFAATTWQYRIAAQ